MNIPPLFESIINTIHSSAWMLSVFWVVLITTLLNLVKSGLYRRLLIKAERTSTLWDDCFFQASHKPLSVMIWIFGLSFAADIIAVNVSEAFLSDAILTVKSILLVGVFLWFLTDFIGLVESAYVERSAGKKKRVDKTTIRAISQLFRITVTVSSGLIVLDTLGVPTSGVLAAGGLGGIAIGFAAKDILANILGGLLIFLDRPFVMGDWIRSPDREIEGIVEFIGWRTTHLRTFNKRLLIIPNGVFSLISIENGSRMTNRLIKTVVGVRYEDANKLEPMLDEMEKMLAEHEDIDASQTFFVKLTEFGPSSLNFLVQCCTKTTDKLEFQAVQQKILLKVLEIITKHGAECAFPTQTLHVADNSALSATLQALSD